MAEADGTIRDGLLLVRVTADPERRLLETREDDNVVYALIEVVGHGRRIVVRETGRGASPRALRRPRAVDPFLRAEPVRNPGFSPEACPAAPTPAHVRQ